MSSNSSIPVRRSRLNASLVLGVAASGLLGLVLWARAQSGDALDQAGLPAADASDEQVEAAARIEERQFAALAVLHPVELANEMERLKTPEEREADQMALAAVLYPEAVSRAFEEMQGEEYRQQKALALLAITNPEKYAEIMQLPPPDAESLHAILEPQALSTQVPLPEPPPFAR